MLIRPIKCRYFCNLVKEGDEARLISAVLDCVFSFMDVDYWNVREPRNKAPYIAAVRRFLVQNPLVVRDVLMTDEPYWFEWSNRKTDKKGKTTYIDVKIIQGRLEDRKKEVSL